jgi:hypothetical protein
MAYIGSTPTTQSFIAGTDSFNGTGSATSFTLTRLVNSTNDIQVVVNNVVQYPPNYSVSGTTLTISPAPSAGTNNVYVRYLSTTLQSIAPSQGSSIQFGTGSVGLPSISFIGDTNTGIYSPAADTLAFVEGGAEAMRIDSSRRLGFPGAQSTYGAVTVYGTKNGWGGINFNSTAGTNIGTLMIADGFGGFFNSADNAWLGYFTSGGVVFSNGATFVTPVGTAPVYGCRAWVNFNGTGTVAIRASGNVSSITDNGTGDYTVNFTTAMPDANYSVVATSIAENTGFGSTPIKTGTTPTSSSVNIRAVGNTNYYDPSFVNVAIFR